jgi:hypothetical protein
VTRPWLRDECISARARKGIAAAHFQELA